MVDKLLILDKLDKNFHLKIDPQLLPQKKPENYLDAIKT